MKGEKEEGKGQCGGPVLQVDHFEFFGIPLGYSICAHARRITMKGREREGEKKKKKFV